MKTLDDTGLCAPESAATLLRQQKQLEAGLRDVQMFPLGTPELPLPHGFSRHENQRGVFHHLSAKISPEKIDELSADGRENEFLNLGPFSKPEIARRLLSGEAFTAITEYAPDGTEIRCVGGTVKTADEQRAYFERTKESGSIIIIGVPPLRVRERLADPLSQAVKEICSEKQGGKVSLSERKSHGRHNAPSPRLEPSHRAKATYRLHCASMG